MFWIGQWKVLEKKLPGNSKVSKIKCYIYVCTYIFGLALTVVQCSSYNLAKLRSIAGLATAARLYIHKRIRSYVVHCDDSSS